MDENTLLTGCDCFLCGCNRWLQTEDLRRPYMCSSCGLFADTIKKEVEENDEIIEKVFVL